MILSKRITVSTCSSFIRVTHLINGAKFLNATLAFTPISVAFISPVTRIYVSEQSQKLGLITFVSN